MNHAIALLAEGTLLMQCVAIDAREERIAAGDISGRIHMWNAFGPAVAAAAGANSGSVNNHPGQAGRKKDIRDADLAKETLHWHAAAVNCLTFSADGTYLLSGGREAVLVSSSHEPPQAIEALFRTFTRLARSKDKCVPCLRSPCAHESFLILEHDLQIAGSAHRISVDTRCRLCWMSMLCPWAERGADHACRLQVIWRLDTGARTFLPRLQGALTAINPAPSDAACYVVTQADNTIRMVKICLISTCISLYLHHQGRLVWHDFHVRSKFACLVFFQVLQKAACVKPFPECRA